MDNELPIIYESLEISKTLKNIKKIYSMAGIKKEINELSRVSELLSSQNNKISETMTELINSQNKLCENIYNLEKINSNNISDLLQKIINENNNLFAKLNVATDNFKSINKLQMQTLQNSVLSNAITNYIQIINRNNININSENIDVIIDKVNPLINFIPRRMFYAQRKNYKIDLNEAYDRDVLGKIEKKGEKIIKLMENINDLFKPYKIEIFKYSKEFIDLSLYIRCPAQNEESFQKIINLLFKGFYEISGCSNNKIYAIIDYYNLNDSLTIIKHIRALNNHKYKESDKKILIEFQDYCYEKLGIKICTKSKDFLNLQLYIYNDIENMLFGLHSSKETQLINIH